ncbi:zinc-binding dehydrogenase [Mucilaginibacter psychrotolerans]|uniref:alcohol dehydrogenase n=1 Tax=Mucilaginibacter psychrotolerans TaxID=1524096 RepID=A0A4Y8SFA9_9SPHI|nr:zinc-binding dehydrogenase [Mucilaginibacter psychrotolerans]TFF37237.1 alcohol dehydrogenase [Mucilaginibacter psychrotolerans]
MDQQMPIFPQGRAALFEGVGKPFKAINREVPALAEGEILVKNRYTTLCGSDIHTYCGHRKEPDEVVLGHEIIGDILWLPEGEEFKDYRGETVQIGDRITWSIFAVPAGIEAPRADMPQKSAGLFKYGHAQATDTDLFNGGLADYCVLRPNTAFLKISPKIPMKVAATISCAHSTVTGALRVAGNIKGKKVLVFGAGLLGISCVAMCREAGASWVGLIDNDASRLSWGEKFGADEQFIFPNNPVDGSFPWPQADVVFDMTGRPEAMKVGVESLGLGGTVVWIGAVFPASPVPVDAQRVVRNLLEIKGLHNYNYDDFVNATIFIEQNFEKYPFEELVEKEYTLDQIAEAFKYASEQKPVRVGINIDND